MHIHPTPGQERICTCGALISEDNHHVMCAKCRSRARWERRTTGHRRHARHDF
jgi:hypothetical protein